jgi:hypothetical protein
MSAAANVQIFTQLPEGEQTRLLAHLAQSRNGNGTGANCYTPTATPLAELLRRDFPPLRWLVDDMIAAGHLVMLGGRPKSGKSWLVLQLAMAIDQGRPFLGRDTRRGRVLYVALEDGERRVYQRCQILRFQPERAAVLFDIAHFDADGLSGPGVEQVASLANNYDFIIVDTLISTLSGKANENDNPAMAAIVNELARIAHQKETAILLVHHTGKGSSENVFDLLRGASALRGAYDVGMLLDRKQDEKEAVLHMESRDVDLSNLTIRQAEGGAGWDVLGNGLEIKKIRVGRAMVELISEHGEGLTAAELAEASGRAASSLYTQLATAEKHGVVYQAKRDQAGSKKPVSVWFLGDEGQSI